uniref:Caerin-4.3 n=1 Tax=Ranoidea caerulea TaxID=30344 RepID=CR43_RANCA|nr:RecName: Full=Caerin-4.3 [Ranoidea caerulea]
GLWQKIKNAAGDLASGIVEGIKS